VLGSVSRVMPAITSSKHRQQAANVRKLMATYEKARDLINIGAYVKGSDVEIDAAINALPALNEFLLQGPDFFPFEKTLDLMNQVGS